MELPKANAHEDMPGVKPAKSFTWTSRRHLAAVALSLVCFVLDFATKHWARLSLTSHVSQQLIPGLIKLTLVTNSGAAFSLGENNALAITMLSTAVFLFLLFWSAHRCGKNGLLEELGMAVVLGSAFGNLFDRYRYGRVTDFLEFDFISFPVFNVADALIDLGICLVLLSIFKDQSIGKNDSLYKTAYKNDSD